MTDSTTPFRRQLGKVVRRARTNAGFTQDQVAAAIGMTRASITNTEAGRQGAVSVEMLMAIAAAVGADPGTLIAEASAEHPLPAGHVVYGVHVDPPPDGWQVRGVVVLGRAHDPAGQRRIFARPGGDVMLWEERAMLLQELDFVERALADLPEDPTPDGRNA